MGSKDRYASLFFFPQRFGERKSLIQYPLGFILERWQKLRTKKQPPPKFTRVLQRDRRGSSEGFSIGELEEKIKYDWTFFIFFIAKGLIVVCFRSKIEKAKAELEENDLVLEDDGEGEGKVIMAGSLPKLLRALADHNTSGSFQFYVLHDHF